MRNIAVESFYEKLNETDNGKSYLSLIQNARSKNKNIVERFEIHHIFPISLGGSDSPENKIKLTVYEHCLAHLYLAKCFSYPETYFVLNRMSGKKFLELSDLEQVTLEDVYGWSQTRSLAKERIRGTRCSICDSNTGRVIRVNKEELGEYLDEGFRVGISEEKQEANRSRNLGKIHISNEQLRVNKMVSADRLDSYLKQGWSLGRLQSFKSSLKGKVPVNRHGQEKHITQEELQKYLDEGWLKGTSEKQKINHGKTMKGRVRIYKEDRGLTVFPEEAEKYYKQGWKRGRSGTYKKAVAGRVIVSKENQFRIVSKEEALMLVEKEGYSFGYSKNKSKSKI